VRIGVFHRYTDRRLPAVPIDSMNVVNLRNGQFDATTRPQMAALFAAFKSDATNNLCVHFHGGLVSEANGMKLAERLLPIYRQTNTAYPMFFVWESQLLETIRNNSSEIFNEDFFQKLLKHALSFVAGKILQGAGGKGVSITPVGRAEVQKQLDNVASGQASWTQLSDGQIASVSELSTAEAEQLRATLESDPGFMSEVQMIANSVEPPDTIARSRGLTTSGSKKTLMDPTVLADVQRERASGVDGTKGFLSSVRLVKGAVLVVARTISRFRAQRDHGVHATIVEEIFREFYVSAVGQTIWGHMKKDTADAFQPNPDIFGGTAFLSELASLSASGTPPRVTLVAHSAGAEYVCNVLKHAGNHLPASFAFDVVLMAPACRTELFADVLRHQAGRVRNFRCFTMEDGFERKDRLIPLLYPHSLLYFISGVLEDEADKPILGMHRYLSGSAPHYQKPETGIPAVKAFLGDPNRLLLSVVDNGLGLASNSISHVGFDETDDIAARATVDSLCHILKTGF
jgi:hypothetical protein